MEGQKPKKNTNVADRVVPCYCGALCILHLKINIFGPDAPVGNGFGSERVWVCEKYPECEGSVITDDKGRPLGFVADPVTKELRSQVHKLIDPFWFSIEDTKKRKRKRGAVYGWLGRIMGLSPAECHIAVFDEIMCRYAIKRIQEQPFKQYYISPPKKRHEVINAVLTAKIELR